jgi:hypothetical protein
MRGVERSFQVLARASAGIDEAGVAKAAPGVEIKTSALALRVRCEWAAPVRAFVPFQTEPAQVLEHGADEFGLRAMHIQVFVAENELAASRAGAPPRYPEGAGMPQVQIPCR